jgi:hypothetical protein
MKNPGMVLAALGLIAVVIIGIAVYILLNFSTISLSTAIILFAICILALLGVTAVLWITFKKAASGK